MAEVKFELTLDKSEMNKELIRIFKPKFRNAVIKTTEFIYGKLWNAVPGKGTLKYELRYDYKFTSDLKANIYVGFLDGSKADHIASWTDMGTGYRGNTTFISFFDEKMPIFTIPIFPIRAKCLHWINNKGEDVFAKYSLGQKGQAWFRKTMFINQDKAIVIFSEELYK